MILDAVIVCLNYSDFLEHTLPENLHYLDDLVVVTSHEDRATQKVCKKYSVRCIQTGCFTEYGDTFNKGKAINIGLGNLKRSDWLLHIDADIVLPHDFRHLLRMHQLSTKNIYGADRINVYGYEAWKKIKDYRVPHHEGYWFVDPGFCHTPNAPTQGLKFGARVVHKEHGYVPIGYFQLWHTTANMSYNYRLGSAMGADVFFPLQWPRENRILLPEVVVYHLDSDTKHNKGVNWKGRKSPLFGPRKV